MMKLSMGQAVGMTLLFAMIAIACIQPVIYPMDIGQQDLNHILSPANTLHWLGTDHLGRDMFARLASAIRLSLGLALISVACAALTGVTCGILAGLSQGWDRLFNFMCDLIMALPGLLLILLFAALAPESFWALYLGISLVMWGEFFRISRAITSTVAHRAELESSRLMGMGWLYCIRRHLLPKLAPMLLTLSAFAMANAILALATLGFIHVGLRPPTAELGLMMTELFPYYYQAPLIFLQPVLCVFILVLSLQLLSGRLANDTFKH